MSTPIKMMFFNLDIYFKSFVKRLCTGTKGGTISSYSAFITGTKSIYIMTKSEKKQFLADLVPVLKVE
jgi:hypothetical protein